MTGNRKPATKKAQKTKTHKQSKHKPNKKKNKPQNKNRTSQLGMVYPKAAMRRNDKAKDVPSGNFTIQALRWLHKVLGDSNLQNCFPPFVDSFWKTKLNPDKREELLGMIWQSKSMAAGHPFGVQASELCSLGIFPWIYRFLRT